MSAVYKRLDECTDHCLVHSGQHFDTILSGTFFDEFNIREPDYNLDIGKDSPSHWMQLSNLTRRLFELIKRESLNPDLILFLGDSNSVCCSLPLKKEGFKIGHIEAGMRSGDRRMLEEINRVTCDHCSDILFTYHNDYRDNLLLENVKQESIHVVGNTIVEVCKPIADKLKQRPSARNQIIVDIHRPESINDPNRLHNILRLAEYLGNVYRVPVRFLKFSRTMRAIKKAGLDFGSITPVALMGYGDFLREQYDSVCLVSDSGTAQEETALLNTPVLVPRDYTERPQSVVFGCSAMVNANNVRQVDVNRYVEWVDMTLSEPDRMKTEWLGDGNTAQKIVEIIERIIR
jgi:UDP-N-acetylglucosamine 2-epimerase (non-hydrolysing)